MRLDPRTKLPAERVVLFTDAVLAIAITLLALELPIPTGETNAELLHSLAEHRDHYIAFGISFLVIAAYWRAHHRLFLRVDVVTPRLIACNTAWLFAQIVMPFATEIISGDGAFEARFTLYACVQVLAGGMFLLIAREAVRVEDDDADLVALRRTTAGSAVQTAGFLLSIPVAFVTHWAYALWALAPMAHSLYGRIRYRNTTED
ncbi:TMEM175 family protein [Actinokineospora enzanensis]|uniref:TMEM175 family protein n=1 Tax=Actinokineospora enzanensis TaxID=155975 RepID=UPI00036A1C19|nr:TMEM175 family protein [Actinokineospora enzanensis]